MKNKQKREERRTLTLSEEDSLCCEKNAKRNNWNINGQRKNLGAFVEMRLGRAALKQTINLAPNLFDSMTLCILGLL
jgi:hypothetical protein